MNKLLAANAAANLYFYIGGIQNCLDCGGVVSSSCYSIQIDHMQMSKPVLAPRDRNANWIRNANDFFVVRAGRELNTRSAAKVQRGDRNHLAR